jgi:predicted RNA polymerase sigma factor
VWWVTGRKEPARTDLLVRLGRRGDAAAAYAQAIAGTANETEQRFLRRRLGAHHVQ